MGGSSRILSFIIHQQEIIMWDGDNEFSYKQPVAAGDSNHVVDMGGPDVGKGTPIFLQVTLSRGVTGGPLVVSLMTSARSDFATSKKVADFPIPAETVEAGGDVLSAPLPNGCLRYLKLAYAGATGGTVTAGLTQGRQTA